MLYVSSYYGIMNLSDPCLMHHGVKGMRWGVWNDETRARYAGGKRRINDFARENFQNAKTANVDSWGKDDSHNVLFVTGLSGSGKSTAVESLRDKHTNVIHLDYYVEVNKPEFEEFRDSEFTSHLLKASPDFFNRVHDQDRKKRWEALDELENAIKTFGKEQYSNGKRVIAEGVQLTDDTLFPDKSYFKGQPMVILTTDADTSNARGNERDGIDSSDIETIRKRVEAQKYWSRRLDALGDTVEARIGQEYMDYLLKRHKEG